MNNIRVLVAIKMKDGSTCFLAKPTLHKPKMHLVKTRAAAYGFPDEWCARVVSDVFWGNHWDHHTMETRSLVEMRLK